MESPAIRSHASGALADRRTLGALAVAGLAVAAIGWLIAPERLCPNFLLAAFYVLGLGLAGVAFLAFGFVTKARWSVALRPVPVAMARTLPLGAGLLMLALAGIPWIYAWHTEPLHGSKGAWLSAGPIVVRAIVILAVWLGFAAWLARLAGDARSEGRAVRVSAVFIVVFALTFSLATFDWIMSVEAHWFSTVYAIYVFTGMFVAGLAAMTVIGIALRRAGTRLLSDDALHDLGQLTIGFTTFWAYIWFCQHMLIWYAHIPEETGYYVVRFEGAWGPLMILNLVVNWLIPFLVLLPRPSKRNESIMLGIAVLLLFGHWLDLWLMIAPPSLGHGPAFGLWEIAPLAGAVALFVLVFARAFRRARPS